MAKKPLLLRDFLALQDRNSDSRNSFASFPRTQPPDSPTVRFLLEAERRRHAAAGDKNISEAKLVRSRSKRALVTRISSAIFRYWSFSSPTRPAAGQSSKKQLLSRRFWTKKITKINEEVDYNRVVTVKDIVRLNSFELYGEHRRRSSSICSYFPSPIVSSCSSCSGHGSDGSFLSSPSEGSSSDCHRQSPVRSIEINQQEKRQWQSEEEKEQLSPVSVMDFPYQQDDGNDDEEEGGEASFANIEKTKHQLQQKNQIRRFEAPAELGPTVLKLTFYDPDDVAESEGTAAWDLIIRRLRADREVEPRIERLLEDFFRQGLSWSSADGLLSAARYWIDGGACSDHGKAQLAEMERTGGWATAGVKDGTDEVAADVEGLVLGSLLHELALDLVSACCCH